MSWADIVEQRRLVLKFGSAFFALAIIAAVAGVFSPGVGTFAVVFVLLGSQCFSAAVLLRRIADLQAAVDMKALCQQAPGPGAVVVAKVGGEFDIAELSAVGRKLRFHTSAKFEVIP